MESTDLNKLFKQTSNNYMTSFDTISDDGCQYIYGNDEASDNSRILSNWAFIIIITILIILFTKYMMGDKEDFVYRVNPQACRNCGDLGSYGCSRCTNCGYCLSESGKWNCVPGDENGAYFADDCIAYQHNGAGYDLLSVNPHIYRTKNWEDRYFHDIRGFPYDKTHHHAARRDYWSDKSARTPSHRRTKTRTHHKK